MAMQSPVIMQDPEDAVVVAKINAPKNSGDMSIGVERTSGPCTDEVRNHTSCLHTTRHGCYDGVDLLHVAGEEQRLDQGDE